jgi:sRNA-binding regulator protein Hfq
MGKEGQDITAKYMKPVTGKQLEVTLHLCDGRKLAGRVVEFDDKALIVSEGNALRLVRWSAVVQVSPPGLQSLGGGGC